MAFAIPTEVIVLLVIWTLFWKAYALWRAGRNNQPVWFFILFVFESIGLLPMIYLRFFQKKRK